MFCVCVFCFVFVFVFCASVVIRIFEIRFVYFGRDGIVYLCFGRHYDFLRYIFVYFRIDGIVYFNSNGFV